MTGNFFNKKKTGADFLSPFSKEVYGASTVLANKGGVVTHFVRYDIPQALCLRDVFHLRVFHTCMRRKSLNLLKFLISANNLNKYTLSHTQN